MDPSRFLEVVSEIEYTTFASPAITSYISVRLVIERFPKISSAQLIPPPLAPITWPTLLYS